MGNLYKFQCLCFSLGPAPKIFTNLLKIPIAILRRLNVRIVIYLDDMLILGYSWEEVIQSRDTVIFLLQHLGFVMNQKKCVLKPSQEMVFLGLEVNSVTMTLSLTPEKLLKIKSQCTITKDNMSATVLELTN